VFSVAPVGCEVDIRSRRTHQARVERVITNPTAWTSERFGQDAYAQRRDIVRLLIHGSIGTFTV